MAGKPVLALVAVGMLMLVLATTLHVGAFSLVFTNCTSTIVSYNNQAIQSNMMNGYVFTVVGPVTVVVYVNVSSPYYAPVELVFGPITSAGYVSTTWHSPTSSTLVGTYTINVTEPGKYFIGVFSPNAWTYVNGFMNVTMCGESAFSSWLNQFLSPSNTPVGEEMAPMGIASYGVIEAGGQYYAYTLTTDAVKGVVYIPQGITVSDYYQDGSYYNNTFSIQLNAYVVVKLANGQTQYYWIQNVVGPWNGQLWVWDSVWNETTYISHLDLANIQGNGSVYFDGQDFGYYYGYTMQSPVSFGWITLKMRTYASGGSVVIEFYADGKRYDTVTITPSSPVTSANIVIAPTESFRTTPLDLELVLAGHDSGIPYAVLQSGSINMSLYVDENGHWVPPPSAWTTGRATYERSYASVSGNGVGSAVVEPGQPDVEELWGGTIIVTPFGTYLATGTDLTGYAYPSVVDLGNGTRLVQLGIYINGEEVSENALSSVPLGSLVLEDYERQYLVTQSSIFGTWSYWLSEGTQFVPSASTHVVNGVVFEPVGMLVNGFSAPITTLIANEPMNIEIIYQAVANVSTTAWGMPALYATATMTCGSGVATATGFLTSELTVSMLNPPTYKCTVSVNTVPLLPAIIVLVAVVIVATAVAMVKARSRVKVNTVEEKVEVRRRVEVPRIRVGDAGKHAERAMKLLRKGRFEDALVEIDRAIGLDSRNPNYYGVKAEILTRLGRLDEALVVYDEATRLDPRNPDYHYAKARILMALGSPEGALRELDEAIRLSPDRAEYRLERDRIVEAVEARRRATELATQCFSLGLLELRNFIAKYRRYWFDLEDWQVVSHVSSVVYTMLREGKERNCQNLKELIKLVVEVELDRAGINRFSVRRAYLHGMYREVQEIIRELFPNAKQIEEPHQ